MSSFTPKPGVPIGERFSLVYLERGSPVGDSPRMRHRLAAQIYEHVVLYRELAKVAEVRIGVRGPYSAGGGWRDHLSTWPLQDVLDLVTVAYGLLSTERGGFPGQWVMQVNRIFSEENVHYRVDDRGGVHPYPDAEYARTGSATVAALQSSRYQNVLAEFDAGSDSVGKDNKIAVRRTFGAAEGPVPPDV